MASAQLCCGVTLPAQLVGKEDQQPHKGTIASWDLVDFVLVGFELAWEMLPYTSFPVFLLLEWECVFSTCLTITF